MNVVQFPPPVAFNNIPQQLRELADKIEAGEHGDVDSLFYALATTDDYLAGILGEATALEAIGLASVAVQLFSNFALDET